MSRGTWLALGSLAIAGCSGAIVSPSDGDAGPTATTGSDAASESGARGSDGAAPAPDAAHCTVDRSATFACGPAVTCNRATEYCRLTTGTHEPNGCEPDDAYPFPPECVACPTVACLQAHATGSCLATELDDGAGIGLACGGCYGAPPPRLERLARA
jgi:hypothetical protein